MSEFFRRLAWWRRRRVADEELREELEFHLAEEAAEREDDGVSSADARRCAHLDLGNALLIREDVRTLWSWTTLEQLLQDARYALRTMLRYRLVVGLAVVSLALGIGANTAIYSFMDALLFRALPVPEPEALVDLLTKIRASEALPADEAAAEPHPEPESRSTPAAQPIPHITEQEWEQWISSI